MARAVAGVILGYLVMAALVFATFTAMYLAMGADRAFRAGTYDVTPGWIAGSLVLSVIAALLGGWVCAVVSKSRNAVSTLAALVLVFGVASAVMEDRRRDELAPAARTGPVSNMEAMNQAVQPAWLSWLLPVIGAGGVLAGGRRRGALLIAPGTSPA